MQISVTQGKATARQSVSTSRDGWTGMSLPEILEEREVHKGRLRVVHRRVRHPNGRIQEYEIVNPDSHSVCAVAIDSDGHVLLVELYRFAQDKRLMELPAGSIHAGETFMDAIRRELLEETGHDGDMTEIGSHYIASEHGVTRHVFLATNCKQVAEPSFDQSEIDEGAVLTKVTVQEFKRIVRSGELTEAAAAYMALDHLKLL